VCGSWPVSHRTSRIEFRTTSSTRGNRRAMKAGNARRCAPGDQFGEHHGVLGAHGRALSDQRRAGVRGVPYHDHPAAIPRIVHEQPLDPGVGDVGVRADGLSDLPPRPAVPIGTFPHEPPGGLVAELPHRPVLIQDVGVAALGGDGAVPRLETGTAVVDLRAVHLGRTIGHDPPDAHPGGPRPRWNADQLADLGPDPVRARHQVVGARRPVAELGVRLLLVLGERRDRQAQADGDAGRVHPLAEDLLDVRAQGAKGGGQVRATGTRRRRLDDQ
jgi:hypothetical protein